MAAFIKSNTSEIVSLCDSTGTERTNNVSNKSGVQFKSHKSKFTKEDDRLLMELVNGMDPVDWAVVASKMRNRNSRQCRERWQNYLNPSLVQSEWSPEDDGLILQKYNELGHRWNAISRFFKGRSGNSIRNRFMMIQRRNKRNSNCDCRSIGCNYNGPCVPMHHTPQFGFDWASASFNQYLQLLQMRHHCNQAIGGGVRTAVGSPPNPVAAAVPRRSCAASDPTSQSARSWAQCSGGILTPINRKGFIDRQIGELESLPIDPSRPSARDHFLCQGSERGSEASSPGGELGRVVKDCEVHPRDQDSISVIDEDLLLSEGSFECGEFDFCTSCF